jgi:hypothetical protein
MTALVACKSAKSQPAEIAAAAPQPVAAARTAPPPRTAAADEPVNQNDYVPAEFKTGASRWKDTGVYLDGKPIAFMNWAELPITLKPTWVKDKVSAEKRPGTNDPGWRWAQQRFYKFTDYLRALGVDPRTVKEIHVLGPKTTDTIVATGRDLMSKKAAGFMFRFGFDVSGKAIPQVPENFGNGRTPDKISAVMIYVKKQPPQIVEDVGFVLDGRPIDGVPYYGEPLRGGVRIYLDDRLAVLLKRQDLDQKIATVDKDGTPHWAFYDYLKSRGVDTSKIVEAWVIRDERRQERIPASELATMTFSATAQAKGVIMLGDKKIAANALALHTREIKPDELPVVLPDEDW